MDPASGLGTESNPAPAVKVDQVEAVFRDGNGNEAGNLTQVTDARTNPTAFDYDERGRLIKTTDPLGRFDAFAYDGDGNLLSVLDRKGQLLEFEYDALDQLIKKTRPGTVAEGGLSSVVTNFGYDSMGNLTTAVDPDSALTFTYDDLSRLTSASTQGSPKQPDVLIEYTYDNNANRLTMTDSLTGVTDYVYDALNRLRSITNPSGHGAAFTYDVLSRRIQTTLSNGVVTDFSFDELSRVTEIEHVFSASVLSSFAYTYDKTGNHLSLTTNRSSAVVNPSLAYAYDALHQLVQATHPLPGNPDETFNYDEAGNRLFRDGQAFSGVFDAANRLLEDENFTYDYDENGNLIQKADKTTAEITQYTYDAEDQLIRVDLPGGTFAQYSYDALGRRIEKDVDGNGTRYVYDFEDVLFEFDEGNVLQARYTHGLVTDSILVMERLGASFFYHTDGITSVVDLSDTLGSISQSYVYDSFGNIVMQSGPVNNPFTYTSREFDPETGFYYYRARYYDAGIGRFLQEDIIPGFLSIPISLNSYLYVENNPLFFIDPDGLSSIPTGGVGGGPGGFPIDPGGFGGPSGFPIDPNDFGGPAGFPIDPGNQGTGAGAGNGAGPGTGKGNINCPPRGGQGGGDALEPTTPEPLKKNRGRRNRPRDVEGAKNQADDLAKKIKSSRQGGKPGINRGNKSKQDLKTALRRIKKPSDASS